MLQFSRDDMTNKFIADGSVGKTVDSSMITLIL